MRHMGDNHLRNHKPLTRNSKTQQIIGVGPQQPFPSSLAISSGSGGSLSGSSGNSNSQPNSPTSPCAGQVNGGFGFAMK